MLKVVALSYKRLSDLIRSLHYKVPQGVTFKILDVLLPDLKAVTQELERNNEVDMYISAGGNARLIAQSSEKPLVEITLTGFDVFTALQEASTTPGDVAVLTYQGSIPDMNPVFKALGVRAMHQTFLSTYELEGMLKALKSQGVRKIVGTSMVIEKSLEMGFRAHFIYSPKGVLDAIERCFHIARVRQTEAQRAYTLQTLLNYTYGGIIAVDAQGRISEFNFSAEKMLGLARTSMLGKDIDKVLPGFGAGAIMENGEEEINSLKTINGINILASSIPISAGGMPGGMVVAFQDIGTINESEKAIRRTLYQKGFYAKTDFNGILGRSRAIVEAKEQAKLYARNNSPILIIGESGTGKELFAQAIHNASPRARGPFVPINCASLPPNLLQSELFGYAEGSFTGAKKGGKPGLFEMADKGTLFLDEIGEIPKSIQALLLRAVETREVMRVGGEQIFSTDVRVIAATNRDVWAMVEADEFREDLYYRLCTLQIDIPPLQDRREDIPILVAAFLRAARGDLPEGALAGLANEPLLRKRPWHGNIRELRNIVERFAALYQGNEDPLALFRNVLLDKNRKMRFRDFKDQEWTDIMDALRQAKGNKTKAAGLLGMSRATLWRKMRELR